MAGFQESPLHTTKSSVHFGSTFEEPFSVTSTPLKCVSVGCHQDRRNLTDVSNITTPRAIKSPSTFPNTTNLKTDVSKIEHQEVSLTRNTDSQIRLRNMRFKRQALQVRLHSLHTRTDSLRIRDQQIKRRHSEIRRQRSKMAADFNRSSLDGSTSGEDECLSMRKRNTSGENLVFQFEPSEGRFYRNSETRRAKVWRGRRIPMSHIPSKPESLSALKEDITTPVVVRKPCKKVLKPPSFRLKTFIQKTFKAFNKNCL